MEEKLRGKDFTFIIICLIVIAVGLLIGLKYFTKAFPEASIDFQVTRAQSNTIAQVFLNQQALDIQGYNNASGFSYDGYAKVFLEKELGLDSAQAYFGDPVKLWYWKQRWFKPEQKEEFSIKVTPEGEVIGFQHEIPEEQEGDSLLADSARVLAESFLEQVMDKDITSLEYVTETHYTRPHRIDHFLTYKVKDFEPAPDSDYRIEITIQGSEVAGYREYLRVPETWKQSYDELRSYNNTAASVASLFLVLTLVAIVAVIFTRIKIRDIRWKTAIWFGIVGFALFAFLGGGVFIMVLTAGAETMYRERYGRFLSLTRVFSWTGWRTKSFFKGIILGLTLTAFFFAYQIVFYLIAQKYGAWSPADVPYSNLLNTAFPWLAVLLIGFMPAVSEEFISRAFSIPFLHKYLKSGLLAIVIPAFIWGFGHAGYANQPFYIRGLEVGFAGIIIGLVMLRWGILPALVWHYTVDALYTAFLLFRSGNWYFISTAAVATGILVIPLLIALITYLKNGKFLSPVGIRNQDDVTEPEPETEPIPVEEISIVTTEVTTYKPLSSGTRATGIILGVICLAVTLIPFQKLGENAPDYKITASQAKQIADEFLIQQGVDIREMTSAVAITEPLNDHTGKYFLVHGGLPEFNRLTGKTYPPNLWEVRRFIPGNRDQWYVQIDPSSGEVFHFQHLLPEEAPGDSLSPDSARTIAESLLAERGIDLSRFEQKLTHTNKRPNRMDYVFVYEAMEEDTLNLQDAKYRVSSIIAGSTIAGHGKSYWIPEVWVRQQESTTALKSIFKVVKIVAIAIFFGLAIFYLFRLSKQGEIPWKKAALIAIIPTVIIAFNGINFFSHRLFDYEVTVPLQMFNVQLLVAYIIMSLFSYVMWFLGSALLLGCYPKITSDFQGATRRVAGYDILTTIFLALCFSALLVMLNSLLQSLLPHWIPFDGIHITEALAAPLPFLDQLSSVVSGILRCVIIVGFGIFLWKNVLKSTWLKILAVILFLFAMTPDAAKDIGEVILSWINVLFLLILFVFITLRYLRNNTAAYFTVVFAILMFRAGLKLVEAGSANYTIHGIVVLILGFIGLLWLISGKGKRTIPES
ncbi:hypothetical protein AMJ86_02185 [bacterium SM23_57]|nr:MAG: hypothetical protein AMJ86_02185 [bacterium SM23_57]